MKATGIQWSVLLQLSRRGGLSGHPIIDPDKVDCYIQAIRGGNMAPATGNYSKHSLVNAGQCDNSDYFMRPFVDADSVCEQTVLPDFSVDQRPAEISTDKPLVAGAIPCIGEDPVRGYRFTIFTSGWFPFWNFRGRPPGFWNG